MHTLSGKPYVVVGISEHAAEFDLEVVWMFFLCTDCNNGTSTHTWQHSYKWQHLCTDEYSSYDHESIAVFESDSRLNH